MYIRANDYLNLESCSFFTGNQHDDFSMGIMYSNIGVLMKILVKTFLM